jgi:hypothetical protein
MLFTAITGQPWGSTGSPCCLTGTRDNGPYMLRQVVRREAWADTNRRPTHSYGHRVPFQPPTSRCRSCIQHALRIMPFHGSLLRAVCCVAWQAEKRCAYSTDPS